MTIDFLSWKSLNAGYKAQAGRRTTSRAIELLEEENAKLRQKLEKAEQEFCKPTIKK